MRHLLDQAAEWQRVGTRFAMATVIRAQGSSPHPVGASMLVSEDGRVVGSVSGGCVEAAVCAAAEGVLAGGPPVGERYGVDDGDAFAVGLTCGGTIDVFVREVGPEISMARLAESVATGEPVALATMVTAGATAGTGIVVGRDWTAGVFGDVVLDRAVSHAVRSMLARGVSGLVRLGEGGAGAAADGVDGLGPGCVPECELMVQSYADPPRLLIFGAVEFARPLARFGALLGHRVTLCDARPAFADPRRFPGAHEVVVDRPDRWLAARADRVGPTTAICVLTHDAKFDVPLLELALRGPASYVGAMGSRRTHGDRLERLREAGLSEAELARLRSPIGLDLGGHGPEETALSIVAEIVALRRGGSGLPLTECDGPVHRV
ncbi:XdhC family protein [Streptomyces sp. Tue6028]|uniref:XdhC family protein n=1 Tax=Streptomyces sp. Tue6028 TaxID=2036037 RepID=UPI003D73BDC7